MRNFSLFYLRDKISCEMVKFNERLNAILIDSRVYLFSALGFLNAMRCAVCLRCLGAAAALGVLRAQVSLVP